MCGIVGIITKNQSGFGFDECELFTHMLQMDTIRGKDSTGVFGVDESGKVDVIKADTDGWKFTQCTNYKDFEHKIYSTYRIAVGHNRAATKGAVTAHNAHPFKEENIVLVHNGTIFNKDDLDKDVEVDSHAITKALAKADAKDALNSIHGPFALVWFDTKLKTLNLARNNDRPLFLIEYANHWTISSEPGLPYWLNGREGKKVTGAPKLVPTEKILQFDLTDLNKGFVETAFENYALPPIVVSSPSYSGYTGRYSSRDHLHVVNDPVKTPFKQGEADTFKIDDVKHEEGDKDYIIFGHPMFGDDMDANILVKTEVREKPALDALHAAEFAIGTVTSVSYAGIMPILFVRFAAPLHRDRNANSTTEQDIQTAISKGCTRCKGVMVFTDIASSIVRKKKDGTYRTLCKKCLDESLSKIPMRSIIAN